MKVGDYDVVSYLDKHSGNSSNLPNIGIAVSGGGWRALMNGAGAIKAFDSRTYNASTTGHLGGLLQSATYVAGLSGGSWLLGSIYINNFTTIDKLQTHTDGSVWQFGNSILEGPDTGGIQLLDSASYYKELAEAVEGKKNAGFDTSLTDIWYVILFFSNACMFANLGTGVAHSPIKCSMLAMVDSAIPGLPLPKPPSSRMETTPCRLLLRMAVTPVSCSLAATRLSMSSTHGSLALLTLLSLVSSRSSTWALGSKVVRFRATRAASAVSTVLAL